MGPTLMLIVIDASVAAAWRFPDEESDVASRALTAVVTYRGAVPFMFVYEICNVLIKGEREQRIDAAASSDFLARLDTLPMKADREHDIDTVMRLARKHRLTGYDAAYLETALRRKAPLATLDNALRAAAGAEGVEFL